MQKWLRASVIGRVVVALMLIGMIAVAGCEKPEPGAGKPTAKHIAGDLKHKPKVFLSLPDTCNTPDGMTLDDKTGVMYLACPNFNENISFPGIIVKINPDNTWEKFCDLPPHPDTNRVGTMGCDLGPDGNLYVADNQYFYNPKRKSRLIRVKIKDGKFDACEIAADGFSLANAVIWRDNNCYVSDTFSEVEGQGYIYKVTLEQMQAGTVTVSDKNIIATQKSLKRGRGDTAACDGLTFDAEGNLYCGNFGDGRIFKYTFDAAGKATGKLLIDNEKLLPSADGMFWDAKSNMIYIADSASNAIRRFSLDGKTVETIWENDGNTDGSDGMLDQPCEVIIRGDELIEVDFDMSFPGLRNRAYDKWHGLHVIKLDPNRGK